MRLLGMYNWKQRATLSRGFKRRVISGHETVPSSESSQFSLDKEFTMDVSPDTRTAPAASVADVRRTPLGRLALRTPGADGLRRVLPDAADGRVVGVTFNSSI